MGRRGGEFNENNEETWFLCLSMKEVRAFLSREGKGEENRIRVVGMQEKRRAS